MNFIINIHIVRGGQLCSLERPFCRSRLLALFFGGILSRIFLFSFHMKFLPSEKSSEKFSFFFARLFAFFFPLSNRPRHLVLVLLCSALLFSSPPLAFMFFSKIFATRLSFISGAAFFCRLRNPIKGSLERPLAQLFSAAVGLLLFWKRAVERRATRCHILPMMLYESISREFHFQSTPVSLLPRARPTTLYT
jgi:hypothetical protein